MSHTTREEYKNVTKNIEVLMAENRTFPPSKDFSSKAHISSMGEYEKIYKRSIDDPEGSGEMAEKNITWFKSGIKYSNTVLKSLKSSGFREES
jgi:hypothetical protein